MMICQADKYRVVKKSLKYVIEEKQENNEWKKIDEEYLSSYDIMHTFAEYVAEDLER